MQVYNSTMKSIGSYVSGCVYRNVKLLMLYGSWTDAIFSVLPQQWELHVKPDKQKSGPNLVSKLK